MTTIHGTAELIGGPACGDQRTVTLHDGRPPIAINVARRDDPERETRYELQHAVTGRVYYWHYMVARNDELCQS